jgi:hypothetical protein
MLEIKTVKKINISNINHLPQLLALRVGEEKRMVQLWRTPPSHKLM